MKYFKTITQSGLSELISSTKKSLYLCLSSLHGKLADAISQSVRKRFNISKNNVSFASKIISETVDSGLIKPTIPDKTSKKYASYIPFWA
jgi:hypothetical protein